MKKESLYLYKQTIQHTSHVISRDISWSSEKDRRHRPLRTLKSVTEGVWWLGEGGRRVGGSERCAASSWMSLVSLTGEDIVRAVCDGSWTSAAIFWHPVCNNDLTRWTDGRHAGVKASAAYRLNSLLRRLCLSNMSGGVINPGTDNCFINPGHATPNLTPEVALENLWKWTSIGCADWLGSVSLKMRL